MPWMFRLTRTTCLCAALVAGAGGALAAEGGAAAASAAEPGQSRPPSRCSTAVEDRNLQTYRAYLAALTRGDFAEALTYFASGATVVAYGSVPFAGTYGAADGSWAALQQQYWDFSNLGVQEEPVLYADCDKVILNGQFRRTARATGRVVDTRVIEYFSFDSQGRIVRDDFYLAETAAVNAALGLP
jgi:ketosteroid isomerase-like protein